MKQISKNLLEKLYSNTLPKAGIKISIKKTEKIFGESGVEYKEEEVVSFREKDIINATFSQNVDITGAELPSIELCWEQNYFGEVDEKLQPILEYKLREKMAVDFSVIYNFLTYISWDTVYEENVSWKNIFDNSKTWRDVFYTQKEEEIKAKRTFLKEPPKVQDKKLKWESRDLLYFLTGEALENTSFVKIENEVSPAKRQDLVLYILSGERLRLFASKENSIDFALLNTKFDLIQTDKNNLTENQIFVGVAKDVIKNCLSPICYFIDFSSENGSIYIKNSEEAITKHDYDISKKILLKNQKEYPKITLGKDISNYIFDSSTFFIDYENPYEVSASKSVYESGEGHTSHFFYTTSPSTRYAKDGSSYPSLQTDYSVFEDLKTIRYDIKGEYAPFDLRLYNIKSKSTKIIHKINELGTEFIESNPLNPFSDIGTRNFALDRANFLSKYYNSKNSVISVNFFGDPSIELCDVVSVETNITDKETGKKITKNGIVTSSKLSYNGSIKQNISVHEISLLSTGG